jgi:hypothetical protein
MPYIIPTSMVCHVKLNLPNLEFPKKMLLTAWNKQRKMIGRSVNNEMERMWNEEVVI